MESIVFANAQLIVICRGDCFYWK